MKSSEIHDVGVLATRLSVLEERVSILEKWENQQRTDKPKADRPKANKPEAEKAQKPEAAQLGETPEAEKPETAVRCLAKPARCLAKPVLLSPLLPVVEPVAEQTDDVKTAESWEARIGLYWLSKLGIGFLVVGVCLFIMYTFENFGPQAKIATGFVVSAMLMAVGEYLERRDNIPWYARLLEGGSWALAYFTTYAMHHVASVKIIADPLTDLILLLGVAGLAITHSINKRSEIMAIFSVTLGFLTLALSHVSSFSAVAAAILVGLASILSIRQKWYQLYLYSIFAAYGAVMASGALHAASGLQESFRLASLMLAPALIGFGLVPVYLSEESSQGKQTLVISTIVNAIAFCSLFFHSAYAYLDSDASLYNLTVGMWFFALAVFCKRAGVNATARINALVALTVSTMYFSGAHCGRSTWIYLALETALITWAGIKYDLKSFRWFAIALGVVLLFGDLAMMWSVQVSKIGGFIVPFGLCASLTAIAVLAGSAYMHKKTALGNNISAWERKFAFYTAFNQVMLLGLVLPVAMFCQTFEKIGRMPDLMQTPVLLFSWSVLIVGVLITGIMQRSPYMQLMTTVLSIPLAVVACCDFNFSWTNSSLALAAMLACAFVLRHFGLKKDAVASLDFFHAQVLIALAGAALLPAAAHWIAEQRAVFMALEAVVVLAFGLQLKDKFVRLIAPVIFGFTAITLRLPELQWETVLPLIGCLYTAWALYLVPGKFEIDDSESLVRHFYSVAAAIIFTCFLGLKLGRTWISCSWALEGFVMLALGFALREKVVRVTGLSIFAALAYRLLFIDLAAAETIYRIFAFIVAGLALLLSAYAYSWFARRFGAAGISSYGPRQAQTHS